MWCWLLGAIALLGALQATVASQNSEEKSRLVLVKNPLPVYPQIAISARVAGVVRLSAEVRANGQLYEVRVVNSTPLLDQAALDAVRQWQVTAPAQPGTQTITITFRFVLTEFLERPRPPESAIRTAWLPQDFGFRYSYSCRSGFVVIDSTQAVVSEHPGFSSNQVLSKPFWFGAGDEQRLYLAFSRTGIFDLPSTVGAASSVQISGDEVRVTVAGDASRVPVMNPSMADGSPTSLHILDTRQFGSWRRATWGEPAKKDDRKLAELGGLIRDLTRAQTIGAGQKGFCL